MLSMWTVTYSTTSLIKNKLQYNEYLISKTRLNSKNRIVIRRYKYENFIVIIQNKHNYEQIKK